MTDEQIIIALAKLDGYELQTRGDGTYWHPVHNKYFLKHEMPQYLTSRDAIIPVIEKLVNTKDEVWNFSVNLSKVLTEKDEDYQELSPVDYITATPKQFCIALLKATGKWEE